MISKEIYLENPCGTSSLPYWKTNATLVPDSMCIVHDHQFDVCMLKDYEDTPYFRLMHSLHELQKPGLPHGFQFCTASDDVWAAHINMCYGAQCVHAEEVARWRQRSVYCEALWLMLCDQRTGEIAASGIAELDREIGEGVLEWIQVAPSYRRRGLGRFIVQELLWRMQKHARFATVSGKCRDASNPEKLYRSCGFVGNDVWHVLRKRRTYDSIGRNQ